MTVSFNGELWNHNGPGLITRTWQVLCPQKTQCDFHVLPQNAFYAISWQDYEYFFEETYVNATMTAIKDSILAHVWNKLSFNKKIRVGSNVAYGLLAEKYCRNIYRGEFIGEYF
jgi:lactosylceramide 4-alpha-galactosyltransferase